MNNLPIGAENNSSAPYNEKELKEREIDVLISLTISKSVKIKVSDYSIVDSGNDGDNSYFEDIDYSECDLNNVVHQQVILPQDACKHFIINTKAGKKAFDDSQNWIVNDLTIIKE